MTYHSHKKVILAVYFIFYFTTFAFFALNQQFLSQYEPIFFTHNRDLSELLLIITGIPKFMISHPWLYKFVDGLMIIFPILIIIFFIRYKRFSVVPEIIFVLILGIYLLLQDVFTQLHAEMFIGLFLMGFLFTTNKEEKFYNILSLCRYFFLYLFVSAAVWKIARGTYLHIDHLSNILIFQHSDILTSGYPGTLSQVYLYLINHPYFSYSIYLVAILLQLSFITGFFTRKHDKFLLMAAIIFFIADHVIMRVPFWPIMVLGTTLLIRRSENYH